MHLPILNALGHVPLATSNTLSRRVVGMETLLPASQKPTAQAEPGWPAVLPGLASKAPRAAL